MTRINIILEFILLLVSGVLLVKLRSGSHDFFEVVAKLKQASKEKEMRIQRKNQEFEQMKTLISNQMDQTRAPFLSLQQEHVNVNNLNATLQETAKNARSCAMQLEENLGHRNTELEKTPHGPILYLVFVNGCSMSSATHRFARRLLKAYGISFCWGWETWEIDSMKKNIFWNKETSFAKSLQMYMEEARSVNRSLLFKIKPGVFFRQLKDDSETFSNVLKNNQVKWIFAERRNVLDYLICTIRDCFGGPGYGVLADTGEKTDLCFKRRHADVEVKAYLDPKNFLRRFKKEIKQLEANRLKLARWFDLDNLVPVQTERLFQFEYGEQYRQESVSEWTNVLNSWGILPDPKIINAIMDENAPPYRVEKKHSMTVYNMWFLKQQAKKNSLLKSFIRD